jgi:hypothetical protein
VTSEFHMDRTRAIFDWVFHAPSGLEGGDSGGDGYSLTYLETTNSPLKPEEVAARREREVRTLNQSPNNSPHCPPTNRPTLSHAPLNRFDYRCGTLFRIQQHHVCSISVM